MHSFIHGFLLAFGLILPLGVQNVFIFNQGVLQKQFRYVLPAVITASLCDTILILFAVFGVSAMVFTSIWLKTGLLVIGIIFLLYMGWSTWTADPVNGNHEKGEIFSPKKQMVFAASVSLLNPHAIMDTIGVIGTSALHYQGMEKTVFTCATILVSWLWFFGLAFAGRIVGKINQSGKVSRLINKVSALIIWGAALYLMKLTIGEM
ncbi:LysE/ArgO family amino acid transporter [Thermoflavimicrobium dichotomicum]|uniref:L-lysine exporter family protein LysE/ArgO n=1 Tax=Thermoflavimicrobium dichotomicum TaxID=46223 RepID=A0A1I3L4K0_9BACL|nr:LysE/ArgO family amino acid transporter [Thermoflavimicrobium dichotomicum]SFI79664.1 L-lysine exporter family protein LysE/ArgO [Thermoflavimicrobium dichotomicum]